MSLDSRTPVLVGAGVAHQHVDDPDMALEAIELMALACERAAPASVLASAQSILVPRGTWRYHDPGRLLATRYGATDARTVIGEFGVLQQTLVTRACSAIARGELAVALVVGGEAKYRDLRAQIAGTRASETEQLDATPDDRLVPAAEIIPPIEIAAGLTIPAAQYAIIESALRAARGESVRAQREHSPSCGRGSARSPPPTRTLWRRDSGRARAPVVAVGPEPHVRGAVHEVALLAMERGPGRGVRRVLARSGGALGHRPARTGRSRWRRSSPTRWCPSHSETSCTGRPPSRGGEQLAVMSGVDPRDADHFDLYSCFPSAVQVQAEELRLGYGRPLTVTGGMTFAGGPLDNYNLQALAKMVEVLREHPGTTGLVTCISGMITKHGMAMWSTTPPGDGFRFADVSDETSARTAVRDLASDYDGPGRVDGYTVLHSRAGEPERAIVVATTLRNDRRAVAASTDTDLAAAMLADEWCGRDVHVTGSTFH